MHVSKWTSFMPSWFNVIKLVIRRKIRNTHKMASITPVLQFTFLKTGACGANLGRHWQECRKALSTPRGRHYTWQMASDTSAQLTLWLSHKAWACLLLNAESFQREFRMACWSKLKDIMVFFAKGTRVPRLWAGDLRSRLTAPHRILPIVWGDYRHLGKILVVGQLCCQSDWQEFVPLVSQ